MTALHTIHHKLKTTEVLYPKGLKNRQFVHSLIAI